MHLMSGSAPWWRRHNRNLKFWMRGNDGNILFMAAAASGGRNWTSEEEEMPASHQYLSASDLEKINVSCQTRG